jgi:hypothetical protein
VFFYKKKVMKLDCVNLKRGGKERKWKLGYLSGVHSQYEETA